MITQIDDRLTRPVPSSPDRKTGDDSGPSKPDITKPDGGNELLRRLKKVDPDQAKKYRQRSGQ
ncbi:MAG: ubiquitin-like protein UBact [Fimbriimonadaceae bacterium]